MIRKSKVLFFLLLVFFVSCSSQNDENGFTSVVVGDFVFSAREVKSNVLDSNIVMQTFHFRIKDKNGSTELIKKYSSSQQDFMQRINYVNYSIINDFELRAGKKTVLPVDCHFVDNFNLAPFVDFTVTFPRSKENSNENVLAFDDKLFGNGIVKISIEN